MRVLVRVEVRPTEDKEKVAKAVTNLFDVKLSEERVGESTFLVGEGDASSLFKFRRLLFEQRILDAARTFMLKGLTASGFTFYINKQAAYAGRVSFCTYEFEESPLGPIIVEVNCKDPEAAILWLAPRTVQGVPVEEITSPPDP
ncbi:MAG: RNA-binding domain-containing protein [Thermofilaceae archaeon]